VSSRDLGTRPEGRRGCRFPNLDPGDSSQGEGDDGFVGIGVSVEGRWEEETCIHLGGRKEE